MAEKQYPLQVTVVFYIFLAEKLEEDYVTYI